MTSERAWEELKGAAIEYVKYKDTADKPAKFMTEVILRGAARNYCEAIDAENDE